MYRTSTLTLLAPWLDGLHHAADEDGQPLKAEEINRASADVEAGRFKSLADYELERGL